ncbi:unnamed protein product [Candida verbasci]|uniref:Telomere length regulation protein ELG1 n=1 Tax=Candida verbasci TaxID=1227364 RepID=A0A9W4TQC7_9ASCO|nr:unnamed protein product [Candida verbasci]
MNDILDSTFELENKIYSKVKSSSILDVFKSHSPKKIVKIELKTRILENIKNGKNPYSYVVKLKINSNELARIKQFENPLKTKGSGAKSEGKSINSLFSSMMQASKKQSVLKQKKVKELSPVCVLVHVNDETRSYRPPRDLKIPKIEEVSGEIPKLNYKNEAEFNYEPIESIETLLSKLPEKLPPPLQHVYSKLSDKSKKNWCEKFKPTNIDQLLINPNNIQKIFYWITNAFKNLQKYGPIKNLKFKLKQKSIDSFLNDYEEEPTYSPFLILQGSLGVGKSTYVYTCMKQLNGYIHEINAGQSRNKKDLYQNLKEFVTTQLINNNEKGLVLLEDVNILFEQDARFWQLVGEIINITKRPIILTCEELWNIPKNLVDFAREENSIIFMDDFKISNRILADYLWLCGINENVDVDAEILEDIIDENSNGIKSDIRGCINHSEFLCKSKRGKKINKKKRKVEEISDFHELSNLLNLLSCSDVIEQTRTNQLQEYSNNELVDIYTVDDLYNLQYDYEINFGKELRHLIPVNKSLPSPKFQFNDLKYETLQFIGLRDKIYKKSNRTQTLDSVGIPDNSFLNYITITPLVLDLLPYTRYWQTLQNKLNQYEIDNPDKPSLKEFLNYRDFRYESTLLNTMLN